MKMRAFLAFVINYTYKWFFSQTWYAIICLEKVLFVHYIILI